MAPKPLKETPVYQQPSSEEESQDDEGSSKSKINSKSVNQEDGSNSDSDLGTPSSYKLQPISKSSSKRTHGDKSHRPHRKMPKSEQGRSVGSSSNGCITRLWSEKDEITVLNGLIEFKNNAADIGAFHNFIKGKLQTDFSKDQLSSKIKRLKKRFFNALNKSENGDDPVFSKPHEDKAFKLSKRIWGDSVGIKGENGVKDENEVFKVEEIEEDGKDVDERFYSRSEYPFLSRSFDNLSSSMPSLDMSKSGMSFTLRRLSSNKARQLDQKWKVLITEEVELNHKKLSLMVEQMNMALASDPTE